jgi:tRNA A58 N-methylase Trm61
LAEISLRQQKIIGTPASEKTGSSMFFDYLILVLVLSGIFLSLFYCWLTGISPVSSTFKSSRKIIKTVSSKQKGVICELGAGWGALAFPLARRCPESRVVAYELSPVPW